MAVVLPDRGGAQALAYDGADCHVQTAVDAGPACATCAGCPAGSRLEVVVEPTGPAWLPIAVFFATRGHVGHRVASAKAATFAGSSPATPRPTASTPTPWPACRSSTRLACNRCACPAPNAGPGPPGAGM